MRTVLPILFMILLGVAGTACGADVPYVTPDMQEPGYWIGQEPFPDRVVMTPQAVASFNQHLRSDGLTDDLAAFPPVFSADKLKAEMQGLAIGLSMRKFFRQDGTSTSGSVYATGVENMALDAVGERETARYAFTVAFTDERLLPTDEPLYETPGDVHFDQVQNSGLDPATPVIVLHESADGQWLFVKDGIASGWVKRGDIAFSGRADWLKGVTGRNMAVVVSAGTPIYLDRTMSNPVAVVRMGSRLMMKRAGSGFVEISYPLRHPDGTVRFVSAFVLSPDVMLGFLPYTPRMVIVQAFKLLGAPYGWGDMGGAQDCSRFIHMVFATMGLDLPRNSAEQGRSGLSLAEFADGTDAGEKMALIADQGIGALTLLRLKGHIMLYLGKDKNRLYAMHAVWAYRQKGPLGDETTVLGRVVVSDLSLGKGSSKGSLLERIVSVRLLK